MTLGEHAGVRRWRSDARRRVRRSIALLVTLLATAAVVAWWTTSVFAVDGWWLNPRQLAWRFTPRWSALLAAVIVVVALVCTHWVSRLATGTPEKPGKAELRELPDTERASRISEFRRSGIKGLVVGEDGRVSTSKLQVVIWTLAITFGLLMLLMAGRTPNCPAAAEGAHYGSCPSNTLAGVAFTDLLGSNFRWEYLLLLGWPIALAIAAKQQVLNALDEIDVKTGAAQSPDEPKAGSVEAVGTGTGADVKAPPSRVDSIGVAAGLREAVTDDNGRGSLLDAQYLLFTLITVAYMILQVVTHPGVGLPAIPAALLVLMGISGGGYISAKVIDPVGAKSERGVPPPPVTPGTSEAAEDSETVVLSPRVPKQ